MSQIEDTFNFLNSENFTGSVLDRNDPLAAARAEVSRLWDEFGLDVHMARDQLHVGLARWNRTNGRCYYRSRLDSERFNKRVSRTHAHDSISIVINEKIWEQGNKEEFIDTVRHELAHAIAFKKFGGRQKHNENWKRVAKMFGADGKRCHSDKMEDDRPYCYGCPNGCWSSARQRRSKKVKHPWKYKCQHCGDRCVSYDADSEPPSEPGACAVDSINWSNRDEYLDAQ